MSVIVDGTRTGRRKERLCQSRYFGGTKYQAGIIKRVRVYTYQVRSGRVPKSGLIE